MPAVRIAFALFASLFLLSCLPVSSKIPAGTTVGFKPDPTLLGLWKGQGPDKDAPAYFHFLGNDDGSMTAIVIEPPHQQNLGAWSVYRLRVAMLGGNRVINVQEVSDNGKPSQEEAAAQNMLMLARAGRRGKIVLYIMDDKETAAAIKAGEIAGKVEDGENGDVHLTADAAALDTFMSTPHAAALFKKPLVTLTRIE